MGYILGEPPKLRPNDYRIADFVPLQVERWQFYADIPSVHQAKLGMATRSSGRVMWRDTYEDQRAKGK